MVSYITTSGTLLFQNSNSYDNYYNYIGKLTKNEKTQNFYILARLLSVSDNSDRGRNFINSSIKNVDLMIASVKDYIEIKEKLNLKLGNVEIKVGDARKIELPDNSVDGIVTSPSYSIALDYVQNEVHSLKDLGCDTVQIGNDFIGVRGNGKDKVELYNENMKKFYLEMYRILKPNIGNTTYPG
ncbi:MAG: hypothetical protein ACP5UA_03915 [Candidatus Hydrogenedens sp.]